LPSKIIHYAFDDNRELMITVLAGGTGSIKLIRGLASSSNKLSIISNTGDNIWLYGLYICPDIDTVLYGLANILDRRKGWGIKNDSYEFLRQMEILGEETWFKIGDRDLATHVLRTRMLGDGKSLTFITDWMRTRYAINSKIIPATDDPIETRVLTNLGEMHIQEFWVKHRANPKVVGVKYYAPKRVRVNPKAIQAIRDSKLIIIPPANPISSIGPMLSIEPFKRNLVKKKQKVIAVSPIIGKTAVSGPAIKYMEAMRLPASSYGVAKYYSTFAANIVISRGDLDSSRRIAATGMKVYETDILMKTRKDEDRLASYIISQSGVD
jgi:LPPG:FO 2-phospho-L-lactate transferase